MWLIFNVDSFDVAVCDVAVKVLGLGKALEGQKMEWQGQGRIASVSSSVSLNGL